MARFNTQTKSNRTVNLAGGEAFQESPELEFVSILLTSFAQDQYYRSADQTIQRLKELMQRVDPLFAAKCSVYGRTEFGMRSISHVVAGEISHEIKGKDWTRRYFDAVIYRPDDMMEILSYYLSNYGKPIPNALKNGLAKAFGKFDAYQLAKYRGEGKALSLIDVVNLVHPKPTEKNKEALKKLINGELKSIDTWETKLTQAGQEAETDEERAELKTRAWTELINSRKIGYFALLRNLRNIAEQAPDMIDKALEMLIDEHLIKRSLVLPFRFSTALNEIEQIQSPHTRKIIVAIHKAIDLSLANVPELSGKTLVALDESGSMMGRPFEIGSLFASVLYKTNDSLMLTFSNTGRFRNLNPTDSTLTIAKRLQENPVYSGTNFHAIFDHLTQPVDRIVILSDMQGWIGYDAPTKAFAEYKHKTNCNPVIYSFDLQNYGTLQIPEQNVYCLAGFSEKIFDVMKLLETDKKALINNINSVEL